MGVCMNMPILGKTKQCILQELKKEPLHGYEIARRTKIPVTGIYQHLKELSKDGLIEKSEKEGRRKSYTLTKKGEALLSILSE